MKTLLSQLMRGKSLDVASAESAMEALLSGEMTDAQAGAFLVALAAKGETPEEIEGFLRALRRRATPFRPGRGDLVDTCGTGGDGAETFNLSTASALVCAAGGVGIAKHGNRAATSRSGSADVLEALGVQIPSDEIEAREQLERTGFCFLFAPLFHPALKRLAPLRRSLGVRTVFNALGPLLNPAPLRRQLVGVYDRALLLPFAEVLRRLGLDEAMIVHSRDGLDEISNSAPTEILHLKQGEIRTYVLAPEDFGLKPSSRDGLRGGDAAENARRMVRLLSGEETGPLRDAVCLNAGAALYLAGEATSFADGAKAAGAILESKAGLDLITSLQLTVARVEAGHGG